MKKNFTLCIAAIIFLLLWSTVLVSAQNTSNKGKDFWLAYPAHLSELRSQMSLYITSTVPTSGTITIPGQNYTANFTVTANMVTVVSVPHLAYIASSEVIENKGLHVTTKDPVIVFSHIYAQNQSGSTLALPTPTLGREYYIMSHSDANRSINSPIPPYSEFTVIALENNTTIQITPAATTIKGVGSGSPITVTLMEGQVYQVQSLSDLTGSKVESISANGADCKRIAVFSGSSYTRMGCENASSGDNLYQQLYPISAWGQNFATAPAMNRSGDKFRVLAAKDNTRISVNGGAPITVDQGKYYDFITDKASYITADNPVTVAQYTLTQNCDGVKGDPEMIILSPVEQTLKDITVYSSPFFAIEKHFINVVMRTAEIGSFRLDAAPLTFTPIAANPLFSYAQKEVGPGNHNLKADAGFTAMAYGFGNVESYGYSAGANIKNLNQNITFDKQSYCQGDVVSLTGFASYEPQSWLWEFGDGSTSTEQNPKHTYAAPGTYTVKLITVKNNGNDCDSKDETTAELIVYPNPTPSFSYSHECLNAAILFKDESAVPGNDSQIVEWLWDFGDGTTSAEQHPWHAYAAPGQYNVTLTTLTNTGCTSQISKQVEMLPKPVAAFDAPAVCNNLASTFTNKTTSVVPVTGWEWDFGDGSPTASEQHPSHTYADAGTYSVTLTVKFEEGCQTTVTRSVTIYPRPEVKMELPGVCISDEAQFVNQTTISSGTLSYVWEFGDGATSTVKNPKHKYTAEGVYKVKLTATSDHGCTQSMEVDYLVSGANPQAGFTSAGACQRDGIQFTDASSVAFGKIIRWEWDFGDGTTSAEQNPLHIYPAPGTYKVSLKAYSGIVCYGITSRNVTVIISPTAAFETANSCLTESARFKSTASVGSGSIVAHEWDFGDGSTSGDVNPEHRYAKAGTYAVVLVVTTDKGCQHSYQQELTIYEKPQAAFTPVVGCLSDAVAFRDESSVASGNIVAWNWNFGDGSTSGQQHPAHKYDKAGNYRVNLQVTTDKGCTATLEKTVTIKQVPLADAGPDQLPVCGSTSTTLQANTPAQGAGFWTILNGTGGQFSDPTNPRASFTGRMEERYKLVWTVSNDPCAFTSDEVEIKFSAYPEVYAGPDLEIIEGESIILAGSGTGTLKWSPALSLDNASIAQPTASPEVTTTYVLEATSADGCVRTDEVTVRVLQRLRIPNGISPNGDGINDVWLLKGVEDYPDITIDIYNRWGDKVYTTRGYSTPWNGTRNGAPLPDGAYYYVIDTNKGRKAFTGSITVLRK
ncbi:PKD domain-containing protein [Pontibacter sp. MBLB2868]|uniref:PKD domain-containing protein n=1 Tax=Pontibacter sp. MBLB2868 TaxID=3451555 RepID=UPI003F7522C0